MAVSTSAASALISRAAIMRAPKLVLLIPSQSRRAVESPSSVLGGGGAFLAATSLDTVAFALRSMMAASMARASLGLCAWQADHQSKPIVIAYPFQRGRLFGDSFDRILVEARDKQKAMPRILWQDNRITFPPHSVHSHQPLSWVRPDQRKTHW